MSINEKKLKWVRISPTLSDETVTFRVEGCAGLRLHEFIDTVLSEQSCHCGTFRVMQDGVFSMLLRIEYNKRHVFEMTHCSPAASLALDACVTKAHCNGGWGQMNYNVYVEQIEF